jgi:hypothetical protein
MKYIQVIDGADNCTYSIFEASEEMFKIIFPKEGQNVEFNTDLSARMEDKEREVVNEMWDFEVDKKNAQGIHGTLFFELDFKKKYYPTKKESEMVVAL